MPVYRESPPVICFIPQDMPGFQLQAKKLFLTYAQCPLSREELMDFLWEHPLLNEKSNGPKYIRVARELHEDGEFHLHALVILEMKLRTRSPRFLDFLGHHGKYEAARDVFASMDYLAKEDTEWIERGVFPLKLQCQYNNICLARYFVMKYS